VKIKNPKNIVTKNREATIRAGEQLAKSLGPGCLVALTGELGSGKTTFVKGIAKGLGVRNYRYVNSPSFVIIKEYKGKIPLYHFDVFRLDSPSDIDALSFEEYFYRDGICVIEWADRIKQLLPKKHIEVKIEIIGQDKRKICINPKSQKDPSLRGASGASDEAI